MAGFNRRQLFRLRLGDLSREVGRVVRGAGEDEEAVPFIRPPGALEDEEAFLSACERCHACAAACPFDIVKQFGPAFGPLEGTPFLDPAAAPCHWCVEMPCIAACPSDALLRDNEEPVRPIAKVVLDLDKCLNTHGTLCDTCSYRCPSHIHAIRMIQRLPVLDQDLCTGCGMCIYHCEAEPSAFALAHLEAEVEGGS